MFAVTEEEHYAAKARVREALRHVGGSAQQDGRTKPKTAAKPPNHAPKATTGPALGKRATAPVRNGPGTLLNELPRTAGGGFRIPVQACEQVKSNDSSPGDSLGKRRVPQLLLTGPDTSVTPVPALDTSAEQYARFIGEQELVLSMHPPAAEPGVRPSSEAQTRDLQAHVIKL